MDSSPGPQLPAKYRTRRPWNIVFNRYIFQYVNRHVGPSMADGLLPRTLRTRKMVEFLVLFLMWPVLLDLISSISVFLCGKGIKTD